MQPHAHRFPLRAICGVAAIVAAGTTASGATIDVPAGGDLQAALVHAQPGDTVELAAGASFVGNFTLPAKSGAATITVRTGGPAALAEGARVDPATAHAFAKLRSPNSSPALKTAPGAQHWRLLLLDIEGGGPGDLVELGDGSSAQSSLDGVPHDLAIDRCYIHGDPAIGKRRCVALNSASTTIADSYISGCVARGEDAQAIAGWNGPGPYVIRNNYLEGSGENVLFGGADPSIPDLVPSDIQVIGNTMAKRPSWRQERWEVKNLFELKNARRVVVDGNTLEYNWQDGQSGFAVLFTVRDQNGRCRWCEVSDVTFAHNIVRHIAAGVSILGVDNDYPSRQTHAIRIQDNLFADVDNQRWGGNGYFLLLGGGPRDVVVDHNTIIQAHAGGIIQMDGPPIPGFRFTNNLTFQSAYGIMGANHAPGNDSIRAFLPGAAITRNVVAGGDPSRYPPGNRFPSAAEFEKQFIGYDAGDFRIAPTSRWRGWGTDGRDPGADLSRLPHLAPSPSGGRAPGR